MFKKKIDLGLQDKSINSSSSSLNELSLKQENTKLKIKVSDLMEENRIFKSQMQNSLEAIAKLEDNYAKKQLEFVQWHKEELKNSSRSHHFNVVSLKQEIEEYKNNLRISYEEVVRLTNRLSEAVDTQHSLEMKIKECEQLKAENTRLTVTALQMAKEKADAQSKSLMYEHDLELARTRIVDLTKTIENYEKDRADWNRDVVHMRPHMENIPL